MEKRAITIKFDADVYKGVKAVAEDYGRSFGGQVNYLLKKWLEIYKTTGMTVMEIFNSLNYKINKK
jgi:hypothetical protein